MPPNQPSHRGPLHRQFSTPAATIPDISGLVQRIPNGLKAVTKFQEIMGDRHNSVGIIGFSFDYGGLTYDTCFMTHDGGRDVAEFTVNIPAESGFLRPLTPVSIAEKIYMLSVIAHSANTTWLRNHLNRLEDACFDSTTGKIGFVQPAPITRNVLVPVPLFAHMGLNFPSDSDYKDVPDPALKGFEYWDTQRRFVMDISRYPTIDFFVSRPRTSLMQNTQMYRGMATDMMNKIKLAAQTDYGIALYTNSKGFAENVDSALRRLPSISNDVEGRHPA